MPVVSQLSIYFIRYGGAGGRGDAVSPDVTGRATIAAVPVSIEFKAQLLLVDSLLPTFFCFISCSVFVSDSSPLSVANADVDFSILLVTLIYPVLDAIVISRQQ
jgi:hypothetical protein